MTCRVREPGRSRPTGDSHRLWASPQGGGFLRSRTAWVHRSCHHHVSMRARPVSGAGFSVEVGSTVQGAGTALNITTWQRLQQTVMHKCGVDHTQYRDVREHFTAVNRLYTRRLDVEMCEWPMSCCGLSRKRQPSRRQRPCRGPLIRGASRPPSMCEVVAARVYRTPLEHRAGFRTDLAAHVRYVSLP